MDIPCIIQTTAEASESMAPQSPASHSTIEEFLKVPSQYKVTNNMEAVSNSGAPSSAGSAPDSAATNANAGDDAETTVSCKEQVNRVTDDMTFL